MLSILGILEILIIFIAVVGIYLVLKQKHISNTMKVLWIFCVLIFNVLGVIAFFIWKRLTLQKFT